MTQQDGSEPVTVHVVQGEADAQIFCSMLEALGIRASLRGESVRQVYGLTMDGLGRVEIQVAPEDEAQARQIIAEALEGDLELPDDVDVSAAKEGGEGER